MSDIIIDNQIPPKILLENLFEDYWEEKIRKQEEHFNKLEQEHQQRFYATIKGKKKLKKILLKTTLQIGSYKFKTKK